MAVAMVGSRLENTKWKMEFSFWEGEGWVEKPHEMRSFQITLYDRPKFQAGH